MKRHVWQPIFYQPLQTNPYPQVIGVTYCWKANFLNFQMVVTANNLL